MAGSKFTQDVLGVKVKVETTPGTFEAPDTVLYLERGAAFPTPDFDKETMDPSAATSGQKYDIALPDTGRVNYDVVQKMSAAKADFEPLLLASNFVGTAVTSPAGVSYKLNTTSNASLSMEWIDPRTTIQGKGAKAAFSLKAEIGRPIELTFKMLINYHGEVILAPAAGDNTLPSSSVSEFLFMRKDCTGYTINGVGAHFETFEVDWGTGMVQPNTSCDAANYLAEYAPTVKITQSLTEEGEASFDELKSSTSKNIVISFFNLAGDKKAEVRIPNAVLSDVGKNGADGRLKADRTFSCRPVLGDDNVELVIFD